MAKSSVGVKNKQVSRGYMTSLNLSTLMRSVHAATHISPFKECVAYAIYAASVSLPTTITIMGIDGSQRERALALAISGLWNLCSNPLSSDDPLSMQETDMEKLQITNERIGLKSIEINLSKMARETNGDAESGNKEFVAFCSELINTQVKTEVCRLPAT